MTVLTITATEFVRNCRSVIDQLDRYDHVVIERHNAPVAYISKPPAAPEPMSVRQMIDEMWGKSCDPITAEPDHEWTELQGSLRPLEDIVDPYERR